MAVHIRRYGWKCLRHAYKVFAPVLLFFYVGGVVAQLKPCRIYTEAVCKGDTNPDWEYVLRGTCFRVIDPECVSSYFKPNYSLTTKGATGAEMSSCVKAEIDAGVLTAMPEPWPTGGSAHGP